MRSMCWRERIGRLWVMCWRCRRWCRSRSSVVVHVLAFVSQPLIPSKRVEERTSVDGGKANFQRFIEEFVACLGQNSISHYIEVGRPEMLDELPLGMGHHLVAVIANSALKSDLVGVEEACAHLDSSG